MPPGPPVQSPVVLPDPADMCVISVGPLPGGGGGGVLSLENGTDCGPTAGEGGGGLS